MLATNPPRVRQIPYLFVLFLVSLCIQNGQLGAQNIDWQDHLWSPEIRVKNWTTNDGLPQNSVNDIIKSSEGYLYIATFGGVCRFDGIRFEMLNHPELAYQRVVRLYESSDSALWIGTETNGLFRYKNGEVIHFHKQNGFPGNAVNSISELSDGTIVALIHNRGLVFIKDKKTEVNLDTTLSKSNLLESAVVDKNDHIWISTSKGVYRLSEKQGALQFVQGSMHPTHGRPIQVDESNNIYFANESGIFLIDRNQMLAARVHEFQSSISNHNLVIATNNDFLLSLNGKGLLKFKDSTVLQVLNPKQLPSETINTLFVDGDIIWMGLNGSGLAKLSKNSVSTIIKEGLGISTEIALAVHQDFQNNIWLGTNGKNLYKIESSTGSIAKVGDEMSPPDESIWSIASDDNGNIWLATFGYGLFHGNPSIGKKFTWIENWGGQSHVVVAIYYDNILDRLLVGTNGGGVFQCQNNQWTNLIPEGVLGSRVVQFTTSSDSSLYIATQGDGVKILKGKDVSSLTIENGLSSNSVRAIYFDEDKNLWIGTYGSGLNLRLNGEKEFHVIDKELGLYDNLISTIREDRFGYFWISCNVGVFRVKRSDLIKSTKTNNMLICQVFNESHGMGDSETNGGFQSSSLQLENGFLIYPTVKGVSVFNPAAINSNEKIDKVVIERISYGDTTVANFNGYYSLASDYRDVEFEFTAPFYKAPELIKFEYKLEGYDKEWRSNGVQRNINYTRLAPGEYTFLVRAIDSLGNSSLETASVQLEIKPHWYELFIVQFLAVVLLLGVIVFVVVRTQNQALKRTINEQKIALANKQIVGLERDVAKSERELTTYTLEVIEKNNLLRELSDNLSAAQSEQDIARVKRELNLGIKPSKDWEEFKLRFEKVDAEFIERLKSRFPDLTKSQIRLASLIRLGFTSKQIADFLNNSPGSVDVARSKLRKKLEIKREDDLTEFLSSV